MLKQQTLKYKHVNTHIICDNIQTTTIKSCIHPALSTLSFYCVSVVSANTINEPLTTFTQQQVDCESE